MSINLIIQYKLIYTNFYTIYNFLYNITSNSFKFSVNCKDYNFNLKI